MTFSDCINEIMPEVNNGGTIQFIITRDSAYGDWQVLYPNPVSAAKAYKGQLQYDPYAVIYTGKDFAQGSYANVYDAVLCQRLRNEYYAMRDDICRQFDDSPSGLRNKDQLIKEPTAMINFFEDNVSLFSHKLTDYLTTLDQPFAALIEMCPFSLVTGRESWSYNEDLAADAVDKIETAVEQRLDIEAEGGRILGAKPNIHDSASIISTADVGDVEIRFGEDWGSEKPYYVETTDGYGMKTDDYMDVLIAYTVQMRGKAAEMLAARREAGLDMTVLTADDCLPDGKKAVFTGNLVVVDGKYLSPQYRYAESQLIQCTHGNGARSDAIGRSVFGKELYSGKSVVYARHQILGIADPQKLPGWAKQKMGDKIKQQKPEPAIEPEKPMNYALIKHGQRDEIDFGMFATVAEAKQYAAECGVTNYTIKKLNKESLLASLDKNKAKVERNKAASPAPPKKSKQKEVGD
jgi:hypothetical protein